MTILPGFIDPLGATWDGEGTNFALYSEGATKVELCLFDSNGEETRVNLAHRTGAVWHGYLPGIAPGQEYAYRVHGPYEPTRGARFNPEVLLLDPYAKALSRKEDWELGCFAYELGHEEQDLAFQSKPQRGAPRGLVIDPSFDWEDDQPLRIPMHRTVIYEAHVRGLTMNHPKIPEALRGTYAGVSHPVMLKYLQELGVTAIELMPVHGFVDDLHLLDKGLRNYWGYNSIAFFAPDLRYRASHEPASEVVEFKRMVKALHHSGIEVILDVVYNHTAEGNHLGPTFSFKGIDNLTYYRLVEGDERHYFDYTGTGNSLNVRHPQVLRLIMDSLRYWVSEMHVDGFRFDLASALARQLHEVDQLSSFFALIHDSPILRDVKLIAEPWDVGEGGYQVGNFPVRWAEWNGRYRDTMRSFWKGDGGTAAELGYRLTGSSDLYESNRRRPSASVNFVTAHDGFTLNDLVSYNEKHNDANGHNNSDGDDNNRSWNCGVEGPTGNVDVLALRRRQRKNLMATLLLSQGTPMIRAGDEFAATQNGNNNAYCQDNETSWLDWDLKPDQKNLFEFTKRLLSIRRAHPALHRSKFFQGKAIESGLLEDLQWLRHDGQRMSAEDWGNPLTLSFAMFLSGRGIDDVDDEGRPLVDDNLLLMVNASHVDLPFQPPAIEGVQEWRVLIDTATDRTDARLPAGEIFTLPARSMRLVTSPARAVRFGGAVHALGATYRLQLRPGFGFREAYGLLPFLDDLGITDLYLSPIFAASAGSQHGYDVVDHSRLNPELGSEDDFRALAKAARERGIGVMIDWVPNHMGIVASENAWWNDVLENGPSSEFASAFDIDWEPPKRELAQTVLLPILGDQYGRVLESGQLRVAIEKGTFFLCYGEQRLPLAPDSVIPILDDILRDITASPEKESVLELESIRTSLQNLPGKIGISEDERRTRRREKAVASGRIERLVASSEMIRTKVDEALTRLNGSVDDPESFDALDKLLRSQSYRLASWRVAAQEINYRRFFDVNSLGALRMEESFVFEEAHRHLFELLDEGLITGLRLDHTDGLYDPLAYFESIQRRARRPEEHAPQTPDDFARPLPLLVEKILEEGEQLQPQWPVDGTTGYEFGAAVTGLQIDPDAAKTFTAFYRRFTGDTQSFRNHVIESKKCVLAESLASEVNMLARHLERIAGANRHWRDFTLISLTEALIEVLVAFPVYRTYIRQGVIPAGEDQKHIQWSVRIARRRAQTVDSTVFDFLEDILLLRAGGTNDEKAEHEKFVLRFQQLSGPVMAKAVEDTAFYRYPRFIALAEVGNTPARFGTSMEDFHLQNAERFRSWPLSMITTSTHDTKRGEDAASRLCVLTEMPEEWQKTVLRWSRILEKQSDSDSQCLSRRDEYLFYQALVGAWPVDWDGREGRDAFCERMVGFLRKAVNEAKVDTSWMRPNTSYNDAATRFVRSAFSNDAFMAEAARFCAAIGPAGALNGISKTLLRICAPGIPDMYQGAELWDQSLVDPDNRRSVDFNLRRTRLNEIRSRSSGDGEAFLATLLEEWSNGSLKLFVANRALEMRRAKPHLFLRGAYEPIDGGENVVSFARTSGDESVVVCVPRFSTRIAREAKWPLGNAWGDATILFPPGRYVETFTGRVLEIDGLHPLRDLFRSFPVALLSSASSTDAS